MQPNADSMPASKCKGLDAPLGAEETHAQAPLGP
jgi:hypothetical protein